MPVSQPTPADRRAVVQSLVSLAITLIVMGLLLFVPAGTTDWPRGWGFCIAFLVATLIAVVVIWRATPELFAARSRVQPGTKPLDYAFIALIVGGFLLILPVAGLDFRFGGARTPDWVVWLGYVLFAIAYA